MKVVGQKSASESLEAGIGSERRYRLHSARVILIICASLLMFGATYSHLVSFFGEYNTEMGNSKLEYGIVLATYPLTQVSIAILPIHTIGPHQIQQPKAVS